MGSKTRSARNTSFDERKYVKNINKLKYASAFVSCLCVVAMLSSCSALNIGTVYTPPLKESTVADNLLIEAGVLKVGLDTTNNSPYAGNINSEIIGMDADIAALIASDLGLKLEFVEIDNASQLPIGEDKVDVVIGVNKDVVSNSNYWYSDPYISNGACLFATDSKTRVPEKDDGSKFSAQTSSASAWKVSSYFGSESLVSTSSLNESFEMLAAGEVKYVASDIIVGSYAVHSNEYAASPIAMLEAPTSLSLAADIKNTDLCIALSDVITKIKSNGFLDLIVNKWLGVAPDPSAYPVIAVADSRTSSPEKIIPL